MGNDLKNRKYCVYEHKLFDGRRYIGITCQDPNYRWHGGANYKQSPYFKNAINKYGWEKFEHNILYKNLSKDEACEKEKELIAMYKTQDRKYGFNATAGGDGCLSVCEETRKKMSKSRLGKPPWNKNMKNCFSKKTIELISEHHKGKKLSPEHIKKWHDSIIKNKVKKIVCIETGEIFESIMCASKKFNCGHSSISNVLSGKRQSLRGYHFKYYCEE